MKSFLAGLMGLALFTSIVEAAPVAASKPSAPQTLGELDKAVRDSLSKGAIPGASLVVIEGNKIVFVGDYGLADREAKRPVTPDTVFRVGSITKSWTSIAIMMLVEEGKLKLDDKVADLLPGFKFKNRWEATDPVRVVHLLEHTSGFADLAFEKYMLESPDMPLDEAIRRMGPYESRWKPGTRMAYCNGGPVIAARILEKLTGKTYEEFMAERLTRPMGLASASWIRTDAVKSRLAKSYKTNGAEIHAYDILLRPAGSLNITSRDMARFLLLLLGRGELDGVRYLSPSSIDRMERAETTDAAREGLFFGAGVGILANPGPQKTPLFGHNGAIDGFSALYRYAPQQGFAYVLVANKAGAAVFEASDLVENYLQRHLAAPKIAAKPISAEQARRWSGRYVSISPRIERFTVAEDFALLQSVKIKDGIVRINGENYNHLGGGLFQRVDGAAPGALLRSDGRGVYLDTIGATARKLSPAAYGARVTFGVLFLIALVATLVSTLIWAPSAAFGRLKNRGGVSVRAVPAAAFAALFGAIALLVTIVSIDDIEILGRPTPMGAALTLLTLAAPALGLAALLRMLKARAPVNPFYLGLGWLNTGLVLIASLWMALHGWIGGMIWR
jgi:CubicO group peptidase (beta-lactamase class C family)